MHPNTCYLSTPHHTTPQPPSPSSRPKSFNMAQQSGMPDDQVLLQMIQDLEARARTFAADRRPCICNDVLAGGTRDDVDLDLLTRGLQALEDRVSELKASRRPCNCGSRGDRDRDPRNADHRCGSADDAGGLPGGSPGRIPGDGPGNDGFGDGLYDDLENNDFGAGNHDLPGDIPERNPGDDPDTNPYGNTPSGIPDPARPENGQGGDLGDDLGDDGLWNILGGSEASPVVSPVVSPAIVPAIVPVAIPTVTPMISIDDSPNSGNGNNQQQPIQPLNQPSSPSNAGDQADEDYYMLSATSDDDDDDGDRLRNEGVFDNLLDIQPNNQEVGEDAAAARPPGLRYDGRRYTKYIPAWTDPRVSATGPTPYPYRRPALLPEDRQGLETEDPSNYAL